MRSLIAIVLVALATLAFAQKSALKLKPGDRLQVSVFGASNYDSEAVVLTDGSISGKGYGRLVVEGKTLAEARELLRKRFAEFMKDPGVSLVLISERPEYLYFSGVKSPPGGSIVWDPDATLRKVLATLDLKEDPDLFSVTVFRGSDKVFEGNLEAALQSPSDGALRLKGGDVIAVLPVQFVRVWVTGSVQQPGQIRLPEGADLYQAIGSAGGVSTGSATLDDVEVVFRRGESVRRLPARESIDSPKIVLESGDSIAVQPKGVVRVTVGGEVAKPGEVSLRSEATAAAALAAAGGVGPEGRTTRAVLVRNGQAQVLETDPKQPSQILLDGDFLFVERNERQVIAVGEVKAPGVLPLREDKVYRLSDILAMAGGLGPEGALRRVYLGRYQPDGKLGVTVFALDKFFKDGDLASNPEVLPGDVVLVGERKGITLGNAQQILSSAILLFNIVRN